jgi:hypothetical protein
MNKKESAVHGFSRPSQARIGGRDGASLLREDATKAKQRGPLYVSAKRTQIIFFGKQHLCNWMAMSYATKKRSENLGSFSETNPISGGFEAPEATFWGKRTQTEVFGKTVCIHLS